MKISHEIPKQLFPYHDLISDYPYVLGHLMNQDKEYHEFYKEKVKNSSYSILDNSAFELGKSIDHKELFDLADYLKPKVLVLPDTLHDQQATLDASIEFYRNYKLQLNVMGINCMGVVQGNSFSELEECITQYVNLGIPYIAIPYHCIKDADLHNVRAIFFKAIVGRINQCFIHFLGIENPSELLLYTREEKSKISSIDTSSPILCGIENIKYTEYGFKENKPKVKLADSLDIILKDRQIEMICKNVELFKTMAQ